MKITILNGNPEATGFDNYITHLQTTLEGGGHTVTRLDLRSMDLHCCVGCWGCWVKTPGECSNQDASLEIDRAIVNSDFTLWAAPLIMGFPAALLKTIMDKGLPLIHPYIEMDRGEFHHLRRYARYPRLGLLVEKESATSEVDLHIVSDIFCRTALNMKSRLEFCLATDTPAADLAERITSREARPLPLPGRLPATSGVTIPPPSRLTLFNGSPRGRRGNTPILLEQLAKGFGGESNMHHLVYMRQTADHVQAFAGAECAWIGFPLYTDAMPAVVKYFFEALEPLAGRRDNPPIGFLVQSGFPEGLHMRYIERYLERLAGRLGSPYLGTIVKGNGEGVRMMPPQATRGLFADLQALGSSLAREGRLDPKILARVAKPESIPSAMAWFFQLALRLPVAHSYFDGMLKKNGVYEKRFDRPLVEG